MSERLRRQCYRAAVLFLTFSFLWVALRAAGSLFALPKAIASRSFRTESELDAMLLLFLVLILLFQLLFSLALAGGAMVKEEHRIKLGSFVLLGFSLYLLACLRPYMLLDNHFTTAWFMTGRFVESLVNSLANLIAGVFQMKMSWDRSAGWRIAAALFFLYPFYLSASTLGRRNFFPVLLASCLPASAWLLGHSYLLGGCLQLLLGLLAATGSALILVYLTKERTLGRRRPPKKKKAVFSLAVSREQTLLLAAGCLLLWVLTVVTGRISGFRDVMKLFFGSSIYNYQGKLYQLQNLGVVQALAISYFLSLLVNRALSLVEVKMNSKYAANINAAYLLLFQIWILPLLSGLLNRAASKSQDAVSGDALAETLSRPLQNVAALFTSGSWLKILPLALLALLVGGALVWVIVRLPAFRLSIWFFVWFSLCSYVYCVLGLFFPKRVNSTLLLFICYFLNRALEWILKSGEGLRLAVRRPHTTGKR